MNWVNFLTIGCSFVVGVMGAAVFNWGLYRSYRELQSRVYDLEERIISEIKKRAGKAGLEKLQKDRELDEWAQEQASSTKTTAQPQLKPLMDWRRDKMIGK